MGLPFNRMRAFVACLALLLFCSLALATEINQDTQYSVSLNGPWRFKLEQKGDTPKHGSIGGQPPAIVLPAQREAFESLDYKEDPQWHELSVPGNWEMAGDSPATYNQPDNAIGLYRRWFEVPDSWKGRVVKVNFDGVQNGAEVYLNGQPVQLDEPSWGRSNYHEGGFDAFQADLTSALRFGQKNLLALRVVKNTKSVDLDTGDFFFLGGIHRPVTLFSVPKSHVEDLVIRTSLLPENKAELRVLVMMDSPLSAGMVRMQLEGQPAVELQANGQPTLELVQTVSNPRLWSAEKPNLYKLAVEVKDGQGQLLEKFDKRVGIREVSIKDGVMLVNGVPVKLTGMCRHDVDPKLGSAVNEELWRKDILLMKAANVNAIRTSHYPYGSGFYDLCDELGMYVADEMSACWCPTDADELTSAFVQRARCMVHRDRNHPSIVMWAVGNENKPGKNNKAAAQEMRRLDPTRPRLVSWRKAEEGGVEFDDAHYTKPADIARAEREARRKTYPKTYLENPNTWEARNGADYGCLDLWAAVLDRTWREVWKADHIPGSFLWEWQDRAVCDSCSLKLYDYFPATGINLAKVKGICDAFRNPRPWYYHVKMVYAPVKLGGKLSVGQSYVCVEARNLYSFTDLSELKTTWHLLKGGKELGSSSVNVALAPRSTGEFRLEVPKQILEEAESLRLDFDHPGTGNVATYEVDIRPAQDHSAPKMDPAGGGDVSFPKFNLTTAENRPNAIGWRSAVRSAAQLTNIAVVRAGQGTTASLAQQAALYAMKLGEVSAMEADLVWADDPTSKVVGHVRGELSGGKFSYQVTWSGDKTDIQELGWIFTMPKACERFSWDRKGYWSYYPENHIGRLRGTAKPDSMQADVTKVSRPDAFDFNSTKYNCNWATLADEAGKGLGVRFTSTSRHHCRSGNAEDGGYVLVVNKQCSPPRDISSNVVPDYYLTLNSGAQVSADFTVGRVGEGR